MRRRAQQDWMHDVEESQRSIVFPDTAKNEARFWRNIISNRTRLTTLQVIGIALIYLLMAFPLWALLKWMRYSLISWLVLGVLAVFFLLLRWRVRKALTNVRSHVAGIHASRGGK